MEFFWDSPNFAQIAPEDGHYKIHYWPKSAHPLHKNVFFRYLPALFKALRFQKLLSNMQFLYSHFDNLLQPVWLPEILKN